MGCVQEKSEDDLMPKAQKFLYGYGASSAPTAVELDRTLIRDLFFNVSPAKVFLKLSEIFCILAVEEPLKSDGQSLSFGLGSGYIRVI